MITENTPTTHSIVRGDAREMAETADSSVHLVITSPPYWQLKDYGSDGQIGYNDSYEEYVNNLNLVWTECARMLRGGCRLCVNIGDQFARSVYYGRYKVIPIRTEIIKFCETIGFDYMGAIIWQKATTMNPSGGATVMGSFPFPRNGIIKLDYEFILLFKKVGVADKVDKRIKELSRLTNEEWNTYFQGHWHFGGVRQKGHLAMFPEELPHRLIKMFSFVGDTVLDPFVGSGTTSLAARNLGRNSVGYEVNGQFMEVIREKLIGSTTAADDVDAGINFVEQQGALAASVVRRRIRELPYVFVDPIKLDKKVDPQAMPFGSRVAAVQTQKDEFFTVKEVITAEMVRLSSGVIVRLLGVKSNPDTNDEAIDFLTQKTRKQRVFLKFDAVKYDQDDNLLVYLYLQNKTFINAHLIKSRLVDVDEQGEYALKVKFLHLTRG